MGSSTSASSGARLRAGLQAAPVAAALATLAALVSLFGLRRSADLTWWLAGRLPRPRWTSSTGRPLAEAKARGLARVAERMPFRPRCLPRALLLAGLLRRRGIAADLCLGTRIAGDFDAHAWVEIDGDAVNEAAGLEAEYRCLWRRATIE